MPHIRIDSLRALVLHAPTNPTSTVPAFATEAIGENGSIFTGPTTVRTNDPVNLDSAPELWLQFANIIYIELDNRKIEDYCLVHRCFD